MAILTGKDSLFWLVELVSVPLFSFSSLIFCLTCCSMVRASETFRALVILFSQSLREPKLILSFCFHAN